MLTHTLASSLVVVRWLAHLAAATGVALALATPVVAPETANPPGEADQPTDRPALLGFAAHAPEARLESSAVRSAGLRSRNSNGMFTAVSGRSRQAPAIVEIV